MKRRGTSPLGAMLALTVSRISWSASLSHRASASTSSVWVSTVLQADGGGIGGDGVGTVFPYESCWERSLSASEMPGFERTATHFPQNEQPNNYIPSPPRQHPSSSPSCLGLSESRGLKGDHLCARKGIGGMVFVVSNVYILRTVRRCKK